ncbi:TonB system transport protein ExbD [uncultured Alsobacter sp.]|uniref:TonB system transport protein ExbD n=1 Tax=uncultured Alsobacter sp. TaxID=1748258 RepID=UPI002600C8ED|nr:TonB system transport protein ExbD [uncultured Alsobacter sp.]
MAMTLRDRGDDDGFDEVGEINVTPFIDVILVLLIIFMVAAPLSTVDTAIDLPVSNARPEPRPSKPVVVTLKADRTVLVGEDAVDASRFTAAIDMQTRADLDQRIFLRADRSVSYEDVTRILNLLRGAGYLKVALVGLEGGSTPAGARTP